MDRYIDNIVDPELNSSVNFQSEVKNLNKKKGLKKMKGLSR